MNIDLHLHSSFSDGALTPSELVALAVKHDVRVIAIADHDTVSGVGEAVTVGADLAVDVIPAIELSVQFKGWQDVHLLGYGINCFDPDFLRKLDGFRKHRASRNEEILERVNSCLRTEGKSLLDRDCVLAFARDSIGRPHIARALLKAGHASSMEDAFQRYLVPCDVPKSYWPITEAIDEIHRIGGATVLAHPTSISKDADILRPVIAELHGLGLDGIEVYNNTGWPLEIEFLRRTAENSKMLMTAGSDFHGIEAGLEIGKGREGIRFDGSLLAPLYDRIREVRGRSYHFSL